jgi:hypothetical protein
MENAFHAPGAAVCCGVQTSDQQPFARAVLLLFASSGSGRASRVRAIIGIVAICGFAGSGLEAAPVPENRPVQEPAGGIVTSDSCQSCHPGNYASWHASFHRTMTQLAKPENILPAMQGVELASNDSVYRIERKGTAYLVQRRPAGSAPDAAEPWGEIVLLTGSHTLQMLWLATGDGRTLVQFPFAYIVAEQRWAPVAQTFLYPPELRTIYGPGEWNGTCMDCHATAGRSRFVAGNRFDSRVGEFGIACEACHGAGREHIAANRNPVRRYELHLTGAPDATIANPARMPGPESALVCGQCHSVWAFNGTEDKIRWNQDGSRFQPGAAALPERWVTQPGASDHPAQRAAIAENNPHFFRDRFWSDGMVRVTGRELNGVQASPCFKGGRFSCLSCHEMHPDDTAAAALQPWANQQMKPGMESDLACTQCHEKFRTNLPAHTHHLGPSEGSRCYNCHLPHTSYGLLRGIRSHQVSSPTVQESLAYGRPNACNLCHLDRTLAWTADQLHAWYGQAVPELARDDREISAAVQWLLKGDAGQRALVAWGMGWAPAQQASGRDWLYPYLILTLNDSYAAVRFDAWKSLQTLPGFARLRYDYTAEEAGTKAAVVQAYQKWTQSVRHAGTIYPAGTLLDANGRPLPDVLTRLLAERNNRQVFLAE